MGFQSVLLEIKGEIAAIKQHSVHLYPLVDARKSTFEL